MKISKILCPTDFSRPAGEAFEYAVFMAKAHKAELVFLHVVDQLHGLDQYEILAITPGEIAEKLVKQAHHDLQALIEQVNDSLSATEIVREGKTWVEICKAAQEEAADLIVIGSQGRTGLSHALIGSVAESVVRHAACPVLVVRGSDQDNLQ